MNQLLPQWQFAERHELLLKGVAPAQAFAAIVPGLSADDPWVHRAIALREIPGRVLSKIGLSNNALPAQAFGFHSFTLLDQVLGQEVAFGLAGRFWQMDYGLCPVVDAAAFVALNDQPRLLSVCVEPVDKNHCRLVTHTRVHCATPDQHRRFAPYWYAIRPVSGLIRQRLLQRIARQARATLP